MKFFKVFFIVLLVFSNCNKNIIKDDSEYNLCNENENYIKFLYERGNAIFPYFTNYGNLSSLGDYYFFKKYNLINGIHFESVFSDTCSLDMNKKMLTKKGYDYIDIKWKLDSFQYNNRRYSERILKHYDGIILCWGDIKLPINKNKEFSDELLEYILKIDSTLIVSGFWIIVNKEGIVTEVEPYIKHSERVDSIISDKLLNSVWKPAYDASTKEKVEVRTKYILNHIPEVEYFDMQGNHIKMDDR